MNRWCEGAMSEAVSVDDVDTHFERDQIGSLVANGARCESIDLGGAGYAQTVEVEIEVSSCHDGPWAQRGFGSVAVTYGTSVMRPASLIARGWLYAAIRLEIEKLDFRVWREPNRYPPGSRDLIQRDVSGRHIPTNVFNRTVSVESPEIAVIEIEDLLLSIRVDADLRWTDGSREDNELRSGEL